MNGVLSGMPTGILAQQQDPMMDPRTAAMMQMGLGLMQASGPSMTPVGLGQSIGQAGMQGLNAYHQTNQANQQKQLFNLKLAEMQKAKEQETPFGKIQPKDYTPESLRKFAMTKNMADLVAAADPSKAPPETELAKVLRERDSLMAKNPNDPNLPLYAAKIKKLTESSPMVDVKLLPPDKKFEWEDKLRADYKTDVKAFREVEDAHRIIKGALANPSPASDMAAATKFMKLLDPGSVVRESELNMAMQASGVLDRMSNYHNLLLKGHKLTPQQREDFAAAADIIYNNVQAKWGEMDKIYDESATQYGLDPRRVKMGGGSSAKLPVRKKYNPKTGKFE